MKIYQKLSTLLNARELCSKSQNYEWETKHEEAIKEILRVNFPSGSGFDSGIKLDWDKSAGGERLVFKADFHHLNENGYYGGWTSHLVVITPSLQFDYDIKITGKDHNQIKDYIADVFGQILSKEI